MSAIQSASQAHSTRGTWDDVATALASYDSELQPLLERYRDTQLQTQAAAGLPVPPEPPASENIQQWKTLTEKHPECSGDNPWLVRENQRARLRMLALVYAAGLATACPETLKQSEAIQALEQYDQAFRKQYGLDDETNAVLLAREFTAPVAQARAVALARCIKQDHVAREQVLCTRQTAVATQRLINLFHPAVHHGVRSFDDPTQRTRNLRLAAYVITEEIARAAERGLRNAQLPNLAESMIVAAATQLDCPDLLELFLSLNINGQPLADAPSRTIRYETSLQDLLKRRLARTCQLRAQRLQNEEKALRHLPLRALERAATPTPISEDELNKLHAQGTVPLAWAQRFVKAVHALQNAPEHITLHALSWGYDALCTAIQAGWADVDILLRIHVFGRTRAQQLMQTYAASLTPEGTMLATSMADGCHEVSAFGGYAAERLYTSLLAEAWAKQGTTAKQGNTTSATLPRHIQLEVIRNTRSTFASNTCLLPPLPPHNVGTALLLPQPLPVPEPVIQGVPLTAQQYARLRELVYSVRLETPYGNATLGEMLHAQSLESHARALCTERYTIAAEHALKHEDPALLAAIIQQRRKEAPPLVSEPV